MCRIMETMRDETELATRIGNALEMIKIGKLTLEEVAQCSGLSLEKISESRGRMENTEYVQTLLDLGYKVPTEYLQEVRKAEYEG